MIAGNINKKRIIMVGLVFSIFLSVLYFFVRDSDNNENGAVPSSDTVSSRDLHGTAVDASPSPDSAVSEGSGKPSSSPTSNSETPVSSDAEVLSVIKDLPLPELDDGHIDAILRVPGHPWQKERSENIKGETIEQTIENFANFDDLHLAQTSISGVPSMNTSPAFQRLVVPRLARVRRVLAEGRVNPQWVVPHLRRALEKALSVWPEAFRDRMRALEAAKGLSNHEPDQFDKCTMRALAGTYLLAELGDHESLPLILKGYTIHDYRKMYAPVPPALTLYAMHRLVLSFPEEQLNAEARRIRDGYLQLAECLPPPHEINVTKSWYANYDESDPRIAILDPERKVLLREPTMQMTVYPYRFPDGMKISDTEGKVSERAKLLFEKLERFVKVVYPDANLP